MRGLINTWKVPWWARQPAVKWLYAVFHPYFGLHTCCLVCNLVCGRARHLMSNC